jgi:DNA-binding MarR family transcriptional regulator
MEGYTRVVDKGARDSVDLHVEHWTPLVPGLDPHIEGAVTRMAFITRHLKRVRQTSLAAHGLQDFEYETLHVLGGHGPDQPAGPTELATQTKTSPAAMTGRLDALEQRGFVRRRPSPTDRRKVIVELTEAGRQAWLSAMSGVGEEEDRLLGVLSHKEQQQLSDLLRRLLLAAEQPEAYGSKR